MSASVQPLVSTRARPDDSGADASRRSLITRWLATLIVFAGLCGLRLASYYPHLPSPLALELVLEPGAPGRADPLIVSGRTGEGDFLTVRFSDETHVEFIYDSWGFPGLRSQPLAIQAGTRIALRIEMPAFTQVHGTRTAPTNRIRVESAGVTLLDAACHHFMREPDEIFVGENPIGGSACGPTLRGRIFATDGTELRGSATRVFSRRDRATDWLRTSPWQPAAILGLSWAAVSLAVQGVRRRHALFAHAHELLHRHRWFVGTAAVGGLAFAWLVTIGSWRFNHAELFGNFYDYQMASLLQGRLDVPEAAIGGEAFEARGKLYGYFGPTPALLRLPFTVTGFAFGRLSRVFMLAYYFGCLAAAYALLRQATRMARTSEHSQEPSGFAVVALVGSVALGSTVFYLGSRAFIFHEAILTGILFALWSCWCALRFLSAPDSRWWLGALACGTASLHARPPTGLFALTFLGCVALAMAIRARPATLARLRRPAIIGALCAVAVLSFNGLAYLKFRTFDGAPLHLSRPYTDPGRLERIDGKSFHLVNLPYNFHTYLVRPNLRFEPEFPWLYLGARTPARAFPQARIDLPDHTLPLPYAMTGLFALAIAGCILTVVTTPSSRLPVLLVWLAVLPMTLALFAAVATAQRYTGDFCPFLIVAAALGLAGIERMAPTLRRFCRACVTVAAAWAVVVTAAITIHYQRETLWGVPEEAREDYRHFRQKIGAPFAQPAPAAAR